MYAAILVVPMSTASPSQGASAAATWITSRPRSVTRARQPNLRSSVVAWRATARSGRTASTPLAAATASQRRWSSPRKSSSVGRAIPTTQLVTDGCTSASTSRPSTWVRCSAVSDSGGTWTRQSLSGSARQARR